MTLREAERRARHVHGTSRKRYERRGELRASGVRLLLEPHPGPNARARVCLHMEFITMTGTGSGRPYFFILSRPQRRLTARPRRPPPRPPPRDPPYGTVPYCTAYHRPHRAFRVARAPSALDAKFATYCRSFTNGAGLDARTTSIGRTSCTFGRPRAAATATPAGHVTAPGPVSRSLALCSRTRVASRRSSARGPRVLKFMFMFVFMFMSCFMFHVVCCVMNPSSHGAARDWHPSSSRAPRPFAPWPSFGQRPKSSTRSRAAGL